MAKAETRSGQLRESGTSAGKPTSLWRNSDFVKFWIGETISLYGTQVTNLALPLTAVLVLRAPPTQVGLLRFLQLVPYLCFALLFGVWADRVRRRPMLITANAIRMVLIGLIPLLYAVHLLSISWLLVLAFAIGTASVLFDVSWMSFVPTVVKDPKNYLEANQKLGVTGSSADVVGPGLAGALVGALTAPFALVVDAVSYLASLATLVLVRADEPQPPRSASRRHVGAELRDGLRWVFGDQMLRPLVLIAPFCNFSLIAIWTLFLLYATRDEHLTPALIGIVFSASSVGGLIGGLISRALTQRFRLGLLYATSMTAIFAGPLIIPFARGPIPILMSLFVLSFFVTYLGLGVANVIMISLRQTSTPTSLMARMNAAFRTVLFGGGSLGGLFAGVIAESVGLRMSLLATAIGSAAMVVPIALSPVSRLRNLPHPVTEVAAAPPDED